MLIRPRGSSVYYTRTLPKRKRPYVVVLQGLFLTLIGVGVIFATNNAPTNDVRKVSGRIKTEYEHLLNGQYDANWLELSDDNNLYLFDKNAFQTPLDTPFFQGQKIDVYYRDGTPKHVVALHIYNRFDAPSLWFTVPGFDKTASMLPHTSTNPILGEWIVGIGLLVTLYGILRVMRAPRSA